MARSLEAWHALHAAVADLPVVARRPIADSPLARRNGSVARGAVGMIVDIDDCGVSGDGTRGLLVVDFGHERVLLCDLDDVRPVVSHARRRA